MGARGDPQGAHFPSFSEGLSLRQVDAAGHEYVVSHFPSFSEGLSLRPKASKPNTL